MRFYSLSAEIQAGKDAYYDAIERAQRGVYMPAKKGNPIATIEKIYDS